MRKHIALLIALVVMITAAMPFITSCDKQEKTVESISVVDVKTEYNVGDTINYDELKIKVTYSDNSTETKTVKELKATVAPKADLTKAGNTYYTVTYKGKSTQVRITVVEQAIDHRNYIIQSIEAPEFYITYKVNSADRKEGDVEGRGDFRLTGEIYEVGNVNRFIFSPLVVALDIQAGKEVSLNNVKTEAKVYSKSAIDGAYTELTDAALAEFVTIDNNTYKFSDKAAGKYVKLEISLDEEEYNVEDLDKDDKTLTVEFVVVDGGYNVYDQTGLSVMADLEKGAWSQIWGCEVEVDKEKNEVKLISNENSLQLPADDKPLCEYVGNISTVILHDSITLDPDNMPSIFFWTEESDLYTEARSTLAAFPEEQDKLVGSLRDGANLGSNRDRDYMRVMDTYESTESTENNKIPGNVAIETGISLNMQKAIFSTKNVSVSGNYQSILTPARNERSEGGRILQSWADYQKNNETDPIGHWFLFQMHQSVLANAAKQEFTIKNIAFSGNHPQENNSGFKSAGLILSNSYVTNITFSNVNASQFYSNVIGDGYGDFKFTDGKIDSNGEIEQSFLTIENSKFYNAYSNMIYMWRTHGKVVKSEMKGSGGPLFIMCDGKHTVGDPATAITDIGGCELDVDNDSVLWAYARGDESWYKTFNANVIFPALTGIVQQQVLDNFNKTILFSSPDRPEAGNNFFNVIAAMICEPEDLFDGGNDSNSVADMMDIRGVYTQRDSEGNALNEFKMHNNLLLGLRANAQFNAAYFAPILQAGNNFMAITNDGLLGGTGAPMTEEEQAAWFTTTSDKLCIYISAGAIEPHPQWAPYFGIVLDLATKQA